MRNQLFLLNIIISSCLLFQIQPILAKSILPIFGGGASVWTACMMFFQGSLLLGYLHAFCLSKIPKLHWQLLVQAALVIISWGWLFLLIDMPVNIHAHSQPVMSIIWILCQQIGLPFFVLSSTGILAQFWYSKQSSKKVSPYHWYAWSNASSLITLLAYPFLWEPYIDLLTQKCLWIAAYSLFSLVYLMLITGLYHPFIDIQNKQSAKTLQLQQKTRGYLTWVSWSTVGTMLLLSTTHMLTLNISPMPFLWLLPLSLYLLSFILTFSKLRFYSINYCLPIFTFCLLASGLMYFLGSQFNGLSQISLYCFILFVGCLICHGELSLSVPRSEKLTLFYLCVAMGGWLGSMLVSVIAPLAFINIVEYPLSIFAISCLLCARYLKFDSQESKLKNFYRSCCLLGLALVFVGYMLINKTHSRFDIASTRNFYGHLSVKDVTTPTGINRLLVDGTTVHGSQDIGQTDVDNQHYYDYSTGIAAAFGALEKVTERKIGVIGLGAGVLASYVGAGDKIEFYELNPAVKRFAEQYFTYIDHSLAEVSVQLGDGRYLLNNELSKYGGEKLDLLAIDAFSSDTIPTHLLTQEAFNLYWRHIRQNGFLVIHTSNNHIDLKPVIASHIHESNKTALLFQNDSKSSTKFASEWVVITENSEFLENEKTLRRSMILPVQKRVAWTDQRSSLLTVLKL